MFIRNAEKTFDKEMVFYCYSANLKKYLCNIKNINYIGRGVNELTKKTYWLFLRCDELNLALVEWKENAKNGIKAIK